MQQKHHSEVPPFRGAAREYLSLAAGEAAPSRTSDPEPCCKYRVHTDTGWSDSFLAALLTQEGGLEQPEGQSRFSRTKKNNDKKTNQPHFSVRIKIRMRESCMWKNPPA